MTSLDMVFELARRPKLQIAAFSVAGKWPFGWILVAALMRFEMLVPHVAGAAAFVIADERSFARMTAHMLGELGWLGIALVASRIRTTMKAVVGSAARSGCGLCSQQCHGSRWRSSASVRLDYGHVEQCLAIKST